MRDTKSILENVNIVDVVGRYVDLEKKGTEYYGICPFHADTKSSLQVKESKQIFKCFACGVGGDAIKFLTETGKTFHEACDELEGKTGGGGAIQAEQRTAKSPKVKKNPWKSILPTVNTKRPSEAAIKHYAHGKPTKVWAYHNEAGEVLGFVCRFDLPDGRKEVIPYSYAENSETGALDWRWLGMPTPRPLYDLHLVKDAELVLVVEGEKTADAAKAYFAPMCVTTWIGGANGLDKTDWTALYGKKIILWSDHDVPGYEAVQKIADKLKDHCPSIQFVRNPSDAPKHWDVADAQWTVEEAKAYLKENRFIPNPPEPEPEPQPQEQPQMQERVHDSRASNPYFRALGMGKSEGGGIAYFFYNVRSKLIVRFTPSAMTQNNLISLADQSWWELEFPSESKRSTVEWPSAVNWLINLSNQKGLFDPAIIRGRGVWMDSGRIIVHTGDKLIVDGKETDLHKYSGQFLYEAGYTLDINTVNPLSQSEAMRLLKACQLCNWARGINAYLLAGWCVIAPICGGLTWRPHIWLTGASGAGKSWIYKNIVAKMLGKIALKVQMPTTEAGVRQSLNSDGRPVLFDELEINDPSSDAQIKTILVLARSSSADDTGAIAKGTPFGAPKNYEVKSCFAAASINVALRDQQDRRRWTILEAKSPEKSKELDARFAALKETVLGMDDKFRRRLQARAIAMLPVILHNAEVFTNVAAALLGKQAYGDQLGPMLAGAWSLMSDSKVSEAQARAFIENQSWDEERALDTTKDETACLAHILQSTVFVDGDHGRLERSVGDLVELVRSGQGGDGVQYADAVSRLKRIGIKVEDGFLLIANASKELEQIFKGKEKWQNNHALALKRIEGAMALNSTYFTTGIKCRAVAIPLTLIEQK